VAQAARELFKSGLALVVALMLAFLARGAVAQRDDRGLAVKQVNSGVAPDGRGRLWAVVIGVSSYKNLSPESQLHYAHRDAEDIAAFLRSPNGGGFPSNQIKVLLNQDATLPAIRTALGTWLPRSSEPDDVVYVFFAGHGVVEGDNDGYLLAYDSDPQNLYATALPVAELNRIITERVHAREVVLMADACHSGKIGWASRGVEDRLLINRYLDEVGKSGAGVFRLLASRAEERSYEDARWGGGHGAFTYYLLEGLKGKADLDHDGVVRAAELIDYLSRVVPEQTTALQHPRAAGNIDGRMPLSVVQADTVGAPAGGDRVTLEVLGIPGTEVYVAGSYRGRIRPNGILIVEGLSRGIGELSLDPPGAPTVTQSIQLAAARTVVDLKVSIPERASVKSSPLVAQVRQALTRGLVLEPGGAWPLMQQLIAQNPAEPQRGDLEIALSKALQEIGQEAINDYVHSAISTLRPDLFRRGADAFTYLKQLSPGDQQIEPKRLFCDGRALIVESRTKDAIAQLQKAVALDARAAYSYNALGVAYERDGNTGKAGDLFKQAARLAPQWSVPRIHLGLQYQRGGKLEQAESEFRAAFQMDPREPLSKLLVTRVYQQQRRYSDAEKECGELLHLFPTYAPAYSELGAIYEAAGQYGKAADAFDAYLRLAPGASDSAEIRERAAKDRKLTSPPRLKK
jgi:tetratricopeptide (TPR) repeat protein